MIIGRHSPSMPPACCADTSFKRQQDGSQAVPVALPRRLSVRRVAGDGPALALRVRAISSLPAAPAAQPTCVAAFPPPRTPLPYAVASPPPSASPAAEVICPSSSVALPQAVSLASASLPPYAVATLPPSAPLTVRRRPVPAARTLSPSGVRQVRSPSSDSASPRIMSRMTLYPLQDMLDDSRRELEYYLTHRLRYADSHRPWPQTFHTFFGGKRCEASGQNTVDTALEIAQGIKRRRLLDGLSCHAMSRDIVRRDLHYRRRTAESPAQLARALLDVELINGILTLGETHELSGRLVTSPTCQAMNVIVFADHFYMLDAPRRHYQHLTLPCDVQILTKVLLAFLPEAGPSPAPCFHLHHIGFF